MTWAASPRAGGVIPVPWCAKTEPVILISFSADKFHIDSLSDHISPAVIG
jgi:hypothetical protein